MNHEHQPEPNPYGAGDYQPRHGEDILLDPTAMTPTELITRAADHAPTEQAAQQIREGFALYGPAYAVYLSFADTDRSSPTSEVDFRNVYVHTYRDRDHLIQDTIDDFGWPRDLDQHLTSDPLLRAVVTFDRQAIWDFVCDHYKIIESEDGLHVFEQDP